ncbi:molecular chaperone [Providencia sneebia]|uniref:Periplasmic fimbrial chaperone, MrxD n=1 Tax=Providencia sneebia DSM 19967 TaxID=1141660 RepID=K8WK31_9GAMM|nr:fimbria/pilus periplasmic chaperone [Providencia sneebia]EKT60326.1 Periplasmic fimbrial chaperone, MrxD [Providencia sneebia DSM 19967]
MKKLYIFILIIFSNIQFTFAAINVDRTRIIFTGQHKSVSLVLNNQHKTLPYLAQSWIEDEKGNKVSEPFTVLPFIQRIEPNTKSQLKITKTHGLDKLPQDRESLFYFNVREIPPISEKENVMQIAIQSRLKIFYRPSQIENNSDKAWAEVLKYTRHKDNLFIENPTSYYRLWWVKNLRLPL